MEVLVSVSCLVFNHAPYLRKTLDGFVNQKTNFPFEVIIHDDASTDGSSDIIREYCEKYPTLFRPIFQTENQYRKGLKIPKTFVYPIARGKYIAICEGDDYWNDENKLQLQADYMEAHPDCSMCVHDTAFIDNDGNFMGSYLNGHRKDRDYSAHDIIRADGGGLFQTSSYFARRHIIAERPETFDITKIGDLPIAIYAGVAGYVHYIGRVMSCYRVGHTNSWCSRLDSNVDVLVRQRQAEYEDFTRMDQQTGYRYTKAFAIPRGLRLSIIYRKKLGVLKLLTHPKHLVMVVRTHSHTICRRIRRLVLSKLRIKAEGSPVK